MSGEERLGRLERQVRTLQLALGAAVLGLLALVFVGADAGVPDVLRARRVEVVDAQDRVVVALRADGEAGGWVMVASSGDRRKVLLDARPSLVITDRVGGESVRLAVDPQGEASLALRNETE